LTLSGSEAAINASLATLSYQGNLNFNGSDTLTILSTDSSGTPLSDTDTVAITVSAVGNAPINTVPDAQTALEDTALNISGLSVADVDGNLASTQLSVTNGSVTVTLTGGATISAGANSSNSLTLSGSEVAINATLATLSYQGNANFNGSDTLTVLSTDSSGTPLTDTDTVAITVNSEPIAYQYFDTAGMAQNNLSDVGFDSNGNNSNTPNASGHISALDITDLANTHGPNADYFAIRYETQWTINNSGDYTFRITSDDGSILYVNPGQANNLTVNNDGNHGSVAQTGTLYLPAGNHSLVINYFEATAQEVCLLEIRGPDTGGNFVDISTLISSLSAPPIVIDLDGDGVEFIGLDAGYSLDMSDSGVANITAFAAPDDAVLVFDADHNGLVSNTREFMFADYIEGASTDLEGLRFF
jgi:hypothetical protein